MGTETLLKPFQPRDGISERSDQERDVAGYFSIQIFGQTAYRQLAERGDCAERQIDVGEWTAEEGGDGAAVERLSEGYA